MSRESPPSCSCERVNFANSVYKLKKTKVVKMVKLHLKFKEI